MTIIDRSPHAWPVSYLEKGFDAAVNWPNLDFKFRNDKNTPVFLIAYYSKRTLTIEIYGMLGAPGESIGLETQLISTTQPPSEPLMQPNPSLPPNTTKELKQARPGYVVDTYRIFLRNGSEYRREKLFSSKYNMVQQVIEYN
jgi:vancomycin resistance protein YoaR